MDVEDPPDAGTASNPATETPQLPITATDASTRLVNALGNVGIYDLSALCELTLSQVRRIPNLGAKSVAELQEILDRSGMTLAPEGAPEPPHAPPIRREDPRLADIVERRSDGQTLDEIGRAHGITRERVRQILRGAEPMLKESRTARAARDLEAAVERRDEILAAFRRGDSPRQIAAVLGLREPVVRQLIGDSAGERDRAARRAATIRPSDSRYSDEELIAAVREVGERYGRAPSTGEYNAAATGGMLPSLPTIHNRLGWANAVERAGFTPRRRRRQYTRRWTAPACRAALIRLHLESQHIPTIHEYEQLAQLDPDLPSLATVRQRMGSWSAVTADLLRLPTPDEALDRCGEASTDGAPDSSQIWLAYLEERLSQDDVGVLAAARAFRWSSEFGEIPDWLRPLLGPDDEGDLAGT